MPIQTRCPSCSAAIPTGAAWCSLCHTDLRPRPKPLAAAPLPSSTIVLAPVPDAPAEAGRGTRTYDLDAGPDLAPEPGLDPADLDGVDELDDLDDEPMPVGRHSREAAPAPRPSRALPPRGKQAPGRRSSGSGPTRSGSSRASSARSRSAVGATALADLSDLALPAPGEATPEQVDELAEAMLTRLAVTEPQPRLLDPDEFPGGRWGLAGAGLAAVLVALLLVYTVLGLLIR